MFSAKKSLVEIKNVVYQEEQPIKAKHRLKDKATIIIYLVPYMAFSTHEILPRQ